MFESGNEIVDLVARILVVLLIIFAIVEYIIYKRQEWIANCLILAERDYNNVASGLAHGGRKERVAERREWNKMVLPGETPAMGGGTTPETAFAGVQYNQAGYRSVAHELVAANEKEMTGKGATMGKAATTAFLLKELYEGNIETAQSKIFTDTKNNDGKAPYIAPGIYELVGFDKFDPKTGFPPHAGVDKWLLRRVVRSWNFPRDIRMIKTDEHGVKSFHKPIDALNQLLQQNI